MKPLKVTLAVTLLALLSLLSACTTNTALMESWQDRHIDNVTAAWGSPTSFLPRSGGGGTFTWVSFASNQYGVHECRRTFTTDKEGYIHGYSYSGCPALVRTF